MKMNEEKLARYLATPRIRRCYCSVSYSLVQFPKGCPLRHDFWITQYNASDAVRIPHDILIEEVL